MLKKKILSALLLTSLSLFPGSLAFSSTNPTPLPYLDFETITHMKRNAFSMMNQLQGWCSHNKANILIDLVLNSNPDVIVEIGVFGGKSLVPMAYALKTLGKGVAYGVDPWDTMASVQGLQDPANKDWWARVDHAKILGELRGKIQAFGLEHQIQLIPTTSMEAPSIPNIDILHIDGNHSEEASYQDVLKWVPLVKKGGWIIFDDLDWNENGSITTARATEWLNTHCLKFREYPDFSSWGIWIKI